MTLGEEFGAGPGLRVALLGSPAFDPSIEQMALTLAHGGSLVVMTDAVRESPPAFWDTLAQQRVHACWTVPRRFLAELLEDVPGARLTIWSLGGEACRGVAQEIGARARRAGG